MRTIAAAAALAATLPCDDGGVFSVHTLRQEDPWMLALDVASSAVSADGRYIAFTSYARLAPADTNSRRDIYVLDRLEGHVTLESVTDTGQASLVDSSHPRLSADGRFLVYETVLLSHPSQYEVVFRDRQAGTLKVISVGWRGEKANGASSSPDISRDGRVIAFSSAATNLLAGRDANGTGQDIYVYEVLTAAISRVSIDGSGVQAAVGGSIAPSLSGDGRYVAFASTASLDGTPPADNAGGALRPRSNVYVRDRDRGATTRVGTAARKRSSDGASWSPAISADGRFVAFVSSDASISADDRNRAADIFVADLQTGSVEVVSRSPGGSSANGTSANPALSADGRYVAFQSEASDLLCSRRCTAATEDINLLWDVFLFDRQSGEIARVSGEGGGAGWMEPSAGPALDGTGRLVVFSSRHPTDAADVQNDFDLFVCAAPIRPPPSSRAP